MSKSSSNANTPHLSAQPSSVTRSSQKMAAPHTTLNWPEIIDVPHFLPPNIPEHVMLRNTILDAINHSWALIENDTCRNEAEERARLSKLSEWAEAITFLESFLEQHYDFPRHMEDVGIRGASPNCPMLTRLQQEQILVAVDGPAHIPKHVLYELGAIFSGPLERIANPQHLAVLSKRDLAGLKITHNKVRKMLKPFLPAGSATK